MLAVYCDAGALCGSPCFSLFRESGEMSYGEVINRGGRQDMFEGKGRGGMVG